MSHQFRRGSLYQTDAVRLLLERYRQVSITAAVESAAADIRKVLCGGVDELVCLPIDVEGIAHLLGVRQVRDLDIKDSRIGALTPGPLGFDIEVKPAGPKGISLGMRRFTMAHEIGHLLFRNKQRHLIGSLKVEELHAEEWICNQFAAALLMPPWAVQAIVNGWPSLQDPSESVRFIERAAKRFGVSLPTLVARLSTVRGVREPHLILVVLSHSPHRSTGSNPTLRVMCSASLGSNRNKRVWFNRTAKGLGLGWSEQLFVLWSQQIAYDPTLVVGKFCINDQGAIAEARANHLVWRPESVELSSLDGGKWSRAVINVESASCVYVRRNWSLEQAYVVALLKPQADDK